MSHSPNVIFHVISSYLYYGYINYSMIIEKNIYDKSKAPAQNTGTEPLCFNCWKVHVSNAGSKICIEHVHCVLSLL